MTEDRHARGMAVRREVLGDAHVDRAEASKTDFDAPFQRYLTEAAWGTVWARPDLDRRTRSLVTIALLAARGQDEELAMHLRATRRTGATAAEVAETIRMVAAYAGTHAAARAMAIAKRVQGEEFGAAV